MRRNCSTVMSTMRSEEAVANHWCLKIQSQRIFRVGYPWCFIIFTLWPLKLNFLDTNTAFHSAGPESTAMQLASNLFGGKGRREASDSRFASHWGDCWRKAAWLYSRCRLIDQPQKRQLLMGGISEAKNLHNPLKISLGQKESRLPTSHFSGAMLICWFWGEKALISETSWLVILFVAGVPPVPFRQTKDGDSDSRCWHKSIISNLTNHRPFWQLSCHHESRFNITECRQH